MIDSNNKDPILIVGCGFLGKATAQLFLKEGYDVIGIVHSEASRQELMKMHPNFDATICDVTNREDIQRFASLFSKSSSMVYAVSSGKGDASAYAAVYRDGLKNILEAWQLKKFIFVSSTSVYAQCDGAWVNELSETKPDRATSLILLEAEAIALSAGGSVARLSGIYGPGRSILLKKFLNNEARLEDGGHRLINQIHRDDGAQALYHLITSAAAPGIYNVTDNTPATQREVYQWIADAIGKALPDDGPADLNRKRGWTSKRISNKKLRETGWAPWYSSYRDALPMLLKNKEFTEMKAMKEIKDKNKFNF
ncbi:MAG: SDR family oxidoreductase [Verrucomicrobia bacterium]|nr:SDR family oxidoreductase [Verrucomicrobiota bacterium]